MTRKQLQDAILDEIRNREMKFHLDGLEVFNIISAPDGLTVHLCRPQGSGVNGTFTYALRMSSERRDLFLMAWTMAYVHTHKITLEQIRQLHLTLLRAAGMPPEDEDRVRVELDPAVPGRVHVYIPVDQISLYQTIG